jgi:hypothetical protein
MNDMTNNLHERYGSRDGRQTEYRRVKESNDNPERWSDVIQRHVLQNEHVVTMLFVSRGF